MVHASPFIRRLTDLLPSSGLRNPLLDIVGCKSAGFDKGAEIMMMGPTGRQVATIGQGIAMRYRILADGGRQVIMFLVPGDLCNPHIYPGVMDHNIAAVTPVRLDRFECESLIGLTATVIGLSQALWTLAEEQNAILRDHITSLGRADARTRVVTLLIELTRRLSAGDKQGPLLIPVTQSLLADAVGLTHIHFNRVIGDLARRGAIDTCRGGILVKDIAWLAELAGEITEAA